MPKHTEKARAEQRATTRAQQAKEARMARLAEQDARNEQAVAAAEEAHAAAFPEDEDDEAPASRSLVVGEPAENKQLAGAKPAKKRGR